MTQGRWLEPRHAAQEAFEKDFPKIETSALDAVCPGCKNSIKLTRRAPNGKIGGWCKRCNRGIGV